MKKPKPGDKVILTSASEELLSGLPLEDQKAILDVLGKPVLLVDYDAEGRAELQFSDSATVIHFIYVPTSQIKAARDFISYVAYRKISVLLAALFVFALPMIWGAAWLSQRWFNSDNGFFAFGALWLVVYVVLVMLHRNAQCPTCGTRLGIAAPFSGKCGRCKSVITAVRI